MLMASKGKGIVEGTCKDIKNVEQGLCKGTEQGTETSYAKAHAMALDQRHRARQTKM